MNKLSFKSTSQRVTWSHRLFKLSIETHNLITTPKISKYQIQELITKIYGKLFIPEETLMAILQVYRQDNSEFRNKQAEVIGYESNFTGLSYYKELSMHEQKAYVKGSSRYKADSLNEQTKTKIMKGLLKWINS